MPRKNQQKKASTTEAHDEPTPAVVYYRMSSDKQDTSIPQQKKRVDAHFGSRYRIVEVYIDQGKSGSKDTDKRTEFLRMIHDLCEGKHKGKVKYILCFDQSRFGRLGFQDHNFILIRIGVCQGRVRQEPLNRLHFQVGTAVAVEMPVQCFEPLHGLRQLFAVNY